MVGAATCAIVESSRSMTAAVTTAPNASHRIRPAVAPGTSAVVALAAVLWPPPPLPIPPWEPSASALGMKSSVPLNSNRTERFIPVLARLFFMTEAISGHRRGPQGSLSGRQAEAARNDQRILDSARKVFIADPGAPITAVAKHAGVGI